MAADSLDGRKIICPVCGEPGTVLLDRADRLRWITHTKNSFFTGKVTGELIPFVELKSCNVLDKEAELTRQLSPPKRGGRSR